MPPALNDLPQRVALVHEWFSPRSIGGAELVVQELDSLLCNLGREPQLVALIDAESRRLGSWLHGRSILTSPIQHLPWGRSHVQQYLPLLPFAIEQINLGDAELVISSSHLVAKGVLTAPDQLHVSYVHTPVRYAWDQMHALFAALSSGSAWSGSFDSLAAACPAAMGSTQCPAGGSFHCQLTFHRASNPQVLGP